MPLPSYRVTSITLYSLPFINEQNAIGYDDYEQLDRILEGSSTSTPLFLHVESFTYKYYEDRLSIKSSFDDIIQYNYVEMHMIDNDNVTRKYLCYITNYELKNGEVVDITLKLDTLTTFYNDIKTIKGNLERCHLPRLITLEQDGSGQKFINADLYYGEDEASELYYPKYEATTESGDTFVVIMLNIPNTSFEYSDSKITYKEAVEKSAFDITDDSKLWYDKPTSTSENPFACKGLFGQTGLTCMVFPTKPITSAGVTFLDYSTFFNECFPLLKDKIISCTMLPPTFYREDFLNRIYAVSCSFDVNKWKDTPRDTHILGNIKVISNIEFFKSIYTPSNSRFKNLYNYVGSNIKDQLWDEEPKLLLYPYSYYDAHILNNHIIFKYQDNKFFENFRERGVNVGYIDYCHVNLDIFSSGVSLVVINDSNKYDTTTYLNQDFQFKVVNLSDNVTTLPSLAIFESQYEHYRNYNKALVDINEQSMLVGLVFNFINGITNIATAIATLGAIPSTSGVGAMTQYAHERQAITSGSNMAQGIVNHAFEVAKIRTYEELQKRKPPVVHGSMSNQSSYFTDTIFDETTHTAKPIINLYFMTMEQKLLNVIYDKFYFYGYSVPVVINIKYDTLQYNAIMNSRKFFNYVKFSSVNVTGTFGYPYKKDIENRLSYGVTIFHGITDIDYDDYGSVYNEETENFKATQIHAPIFNQYISKERD